MKNKGNLISLGSLTALVGFILSGPVGFLIVQTIHPQPAWTSTAEFAANYNSIQNIPSVENIPIVVAAVASITIMKTRTAVSLVSD